jgi:hypothetical protein
MNSAFVTHNDELVGPYGGRGDYPNVTNTDAVRGGDCGRCREQALEGVINADFTPLTPMLVNYVLSGRKASDLVPDNEAVLQSLDQEHVIPFLKRHLHWRIVRVRGAIYIQLPIIFIH